MEFITWWTHFCYRIVTAVAIVEAITEIVENRVSSLARCTGSVYAVRANLPAIKINSDFILVFFVPTILICAGNTTAESWTHMFFYQPLVVPHLLTRILTCENLTFLIFGYSRQHEINFWVLMLLFSFCWISVTSWLQSLQSKNAWITSTISVGAG